jgi:hypothetical protein
LRKKLIWIIPLALVIIAAIVYPWYKLQTQNQANQQQSENISIATSFVNNYGPQAKISNISTPKTIRAVYWTDDNYMHASLYIDGIWFEYAREPKLQSTPASSPSTTP